jgi:hypothetical protein
MGSRIDLVCATAIAFKERKEKGDDQRLKEGFEKFREALERDAKTIATRRSGLPKDWRNRILK